MYASGISAPVRIPDPMLRGDVSGRVPFALVAVILLLGVGVSGLLAAKLGREEGERRAHEAQLEALGRIADQVHSEITSQGRLIAAAAIAEGTDGLVNESRVDEVFRAGVKDYLARHFPRALRGITIEVAAATLSIRLLEREMVDIVPPNRTVTEQIDGTAVETPDSSAPDEWRNVSRYTYFEIDGAVNYTLRFGSTELRRNETVSLPVPIPAPMMEAKLEQATRRGAGDLVGVGRTVKAILASLVQYRLMDGYASYVSPGTSTVDILSEREVALAVNFAIVLEEVRLFRTFDRDAAIALDEALGVLPDVPSDLPPPTAERALAQLLDRYGRGGTLDAVDLYALWRRFDVVGVSVESVFAQAIAAVQDQIALKLLDYLGLMPLADFLTGITEWLSQAWEDFLGWLGFETRKLQQMRQYVREIFGHAGETTRFASPMEIPLAERTYAVWNGSADVPITVSAHAVLATFVERDLLSDDFRTFWEECFGLFAGRLKSVHDGARDLANDVASNIARVAVESGLLHARVSAVIDPKDRVSFLESLTTQVGRDVDAAMVGLRENPHRIRELTQGLWSSYAALLQDLVDHLAASYDRLSGPTEQVVFGRLGLQVQLESLARNDPDFDDLGAFGEGNLREVIQADIVENRLVEVAWEDRRTEDIARWHAVRDTLTGVDLPDDPHLRRQLVDAVLGASGWLVLARGTIDRFLDEVARAQNVAALRAVYSVSLGGLEVWDPRDPTDVRTERFRVSHTPNVLRPTAANWHDPSSLREGDLWVNVLDPSGWSPSNERTPNVHYTNPSETSYRPFATGWAVQLLAAVRLRVETEGRPILGPGGQEPFAVEKVWPLEFAFSIQGYSGWSVEGIAYRSSQTFLGDLWGKIMDFLKGVWDGLVGVVRWILDQLGRAVQFLMDLLEPLFAFAQEVVKFLSDLLGKAVDLLHDLLVRAVGFVGGIVDALIDIAFPANQRFTISLFGFTFGVLVNGDDGTEVEVVIDTPVFDVSFAFIDLRERGIIRADGLPFDITATWRIDVGPFSLEAAFDPFAAVYPEVVGGSASWRGSWAVDLSALEIETTVQARIAVKWTLAVADVEIGLYADFLEDPGSFWDLVERSVSEALEFFGSADASWESLGRFARRFAERLAANLEAAVAQGLLEAGLYVEVLWKPLMAAGVGFRVSFVADATALLEVLRWVVHNVVTFFDRMLDPLAPADYRALPPGIPEHLYVRFEGFFALELPKVADYLGLSGVPSGHLAGMIAPNVAAFGALFGQNWGRWEVAFGVYVDLVVPMRSLAFGSVDMTTTLWLLRGSIHGY